MPNVITRANQLDFSLSDLPSMPFPQNVLMVDPAHFSVDYIINPHMNNHIGTVDKTGSKDEWEMIKSTFSQVGLEPHVIDGQPGLPDMVFCANQSLPFIDNNGKKHVLMSIMHSEQRKPEVPYIEQWYRQNGYAVQHFEGDEIPDFEGCGDAIWHTSKRLLWGGYGFRSSLKAYERISEEFDLPVVALELKEENFYHLDTCLCVLDRHTALIYPQAFKDEGLELIYTLFDEVIEATQKEANDFFACNATCTDEENVIIQQGCTDVNKKLRDAGFAVHEVDTSEFLKSGGSVFCMKQMVW